MANIDRLQAYLREAAAELYQAVPVPPFTAYFHPHDAFEHFNYAIPNDLVAGDLSQALTKLQTIFEDRKCTPRFEFIRDFWPDLGRALTEYGFSEEAQSLLMTCSRDTYQTAPVVAGLTLTTLSEQSALADFRAVMDVQHEGFNLSKPGPRTDEAVKEFRAWLGETTFVLARMDGIPVAAGSLMPPKNGLAEIAGIATLASYRRRGIATKLTGTLLRLAFERGVELVLLTAGDEQAGRVYQRVGFQPVATALAYILKNDA